MIANIAVCPEYIDVGLQRELHLVSVVRAGRASVLISGRTYVCRPCIQVAASCAGLVALTYSLSAVLVKAHACLGLAMGGRYSA